MAEVEKSVQLDNFIEIKSAGKAETRNYFLDFKKLSDKWENNFIKARKREMTLANNGIYKYQYKFL